jgi:hypothetical protein
MVINTEGAAAYLLTYRIWHALSSLHQELSFAVTLTILDEELDTIVEWIRSKTSDLMSC